MKNSNRIDTDSENLLELFNRDEVQQEFGEAVASVVSADQSVTWAKFVLTDDKPNGNGQRIPLEEFDNIIKTGIFKPLKMARGEIKDGHEDAEPLGVITHLSKIGNKIYALAALWDRERAEDVAYIKSLVQENKPVNVSWEVLYSRANASKGVSDLLDTVLRAVTIVGMPAYKGRTQFIAIASTKWTDEYMKSLPDNHFMYVGPDGNRMFAYRDDTGKIDLNRLSKIEKEISESQLPENTLKGIRHQVKKMKSVIDADASLKELLSDGVEINLEDSKLDKELEAKVSELEAKLALASSENAKKDEALANALQEAETAKQTAKELADEIQPLREFKQAADEAAERESKLSAIKEKFSTLNLVKEDDYFSSNADKLLALDEAGLEFMLQEMVAFRDSEGSGEGQSSLTKGTKIPNLPGNAGTFEIKDLAAALRERKKK